MEADNEIVDGMALVGSDDPGKAIAKAAAALVAIIIVACFIGGLLLASGAVQ
jgi:hypothetical protein